MDFQSEKNMSITITETIHHVTRQRHCYLLNNKLRSSIVCTIHRFPESSAQFHKVPPPATTVPADTCRKLLYYSCVQPRSARRECLWGLSDQRNSRPPSGSLQSAEVPTYTAADMQQSLMVLHASTHAAYLYKWQVFCIKTSNHQIKQMHFQQWFLMNCYCAKITFNFKYQTT